MSRVKRLLRRRSRAQSFVELTLFLPVLLIMLAGMTEVVFVLNAYLQALDAARNAGRFVADNDPYPDEDTSPGAYDTIKDCNTTENFWRVAGCVAELNMSPLPFDVNNGTDDVVISVFATHGGGIDGRYENSVFSGGSGSLVLDSADGTDDEGWSFAEDQTGTRNQTSKFSTSDLTNGINSGARNTGFILVEVVYAHYQILDLPIVSDFFPNPIILHAYAVMPLVEAEPTATPSP